LFVACVIVVGKGGHVPHDLCVGMSDFLQFGDIALDLLNNFILKRAHKA